MVAVNHISDTTLAYIENSAVTDTSALAADIKATDSSTIAAVGGAVGVTKGATALGAAIGYNEIQPTIKAYIHGSTLIATGSVTIQALSDQTIGGVVIGAAVTTGTGSGLNAAGSVGVNIITSTIWAYIAGDSQVTSGGAVSLSAGDQSLIVAIAGGVAVSLGGNAGGASIGYNRISNAITAYIAGSTVHSAAGVSLSATSSPLLVAVSAEGAGSGKKSAGVGTLTVNSVSNTVDAHSISSTVTASAGDVTVNSGEAASEYVVALGVAGSSRGSSIGAALAYNYLGGLSPLDPNVVSTSNGVLPGSTTAGVSADSPIPAATEINLPGNNFKTGDPVVYHAGGGTPIGGLVDGQTYYVITIPNSTNIELAATLADAQNGIAIPISSTGSTSSGQSFTLTKLPSTPAVTFNPTTSSISGNAIYPVTIQQSNGTLVITSNGPNIAITGGDAETPLLGKRSPTPVSAGGIIAGNAVADLKTLSSASHTLILTINGTAETVTVPVPSVPYTADSLAAALQSAINAKVFSQEGLTAGEPVVYQNGPQVNVSQSNGKLSITSLGNLVSVTGGNAEKNLLGSPTTSGNIVTGSTPVQNLTIDSSDDTLNLSVNGTPFTVKLAHATYTASSLAAALENLINSGTSIDGLTDGGTYYIIQAPDNGIELAATQAGALSTPTVPVTLGPNLGSGPAHTLTSLMAASTAVKFGPSAVNAVIINGNEVSFASDPGLYTGEPVTYHSNGGAKIGGLTDGTTYYVVAVDSTHIQLDLSQADATSASPTQIIALTSGTGTGTFTVPEPSSNVTAYIDSSSVTATAGRVLVQSGLNNPTTLAGATTLNISPNSNVTVSGDAIHFASPHGLTTGQEVVYHNGGGSIGGLTDGHSYYVIVLDPSTIKLAATYNNAVSGTPVQANVTAVNTSTNQITLSPSGLGLYTGEAIVYVAGSGTAIGGLTDGTTYYAIETSTPGVIQVAASLNNANNDNPITLTSTGTGTFLVPTSSTPIPLSSAGAISGQTITPLAIAAGASFNPSSTSVTLATAKSGAPGATVAVSQSFGVLTITSNDARFVVDEGGAKSALLGSAPKTSGDSITGSAPADLSLPNATLYLTVNGTNITVNNLKTGPYKTADALAAAVQTAINGAMPTVMSAISFTSPHGLTTGQEVVYHTSGAMTVTQNNGTLTLNSNGPTLRLGQPGGDAVTSLFGSNNPKISGTTITGPIAADVTIGSSNDTLNLTANGTPLSITLTHGTYTAAALAGLLQQAINQLPALPGIYNIGGLRDGYTYYVVKVNDYTIQLAPWQAYPAGTTPTPIPLSSLGYGTGQSFTPTVPASALSFGASAVATTKAAADEISFATNPNLATGDAVLYEKGFGTSIGGLNDGQTYYVIPVDAMHIKLASTFNNAVNNQPVSLTSLGTGSDQSLVVKPTQLFVADVAVPLPIPISGQIVSVTAAGAGGTSSAGAGAVNLNFVRMNVDAHISNNSNVQAAGDVDVLANDTSKIGSGTGSVAISVGGSTAINASVGVNDIANSVKAYV
jgi:hypothetical protein